MTIPPADLLRVAHGVLDAPNLPPSVSARGAALLARQALEAGLRDRWRAEGATVEGAAGASFREQILALRAIDETTEQQTSHTWWQLTRACHHHHYELTPASSEVDGLLSDTQVVLGELAPSTDRAHP